MYPCLPFEVKRPVSIGLNRFFAVLHLSKCQWTINRTTFLGPYRFSLVVVLVGYSLVQLRFFFRFRNQTSKHYRNTFQQGY